MCLLKIPTLCQHCRFSSSHNSLRGIQKAVYFFLFGFQIYAYLGAPNMVKWGAPEKILQNAVQTCCIQVKRTVQSKVMPKSNFRLISRTTNPQCPFTFLMVIARQPLKVVQKAVKLSSWQEKQHPLKTVFNSWITLERVAQGLEVVIIIFARKTTLVENSCQKCIPMKTSLDRSVIFLFHSLIEIHSLTFLASVSNQDLT